MRSNEGVRGDHARDLQSDTLDEATREVKRDMGAAHPYRGSNTNARFCTASLPSGFRTATSAIFPSEPAGALNSRVDLSTSLTGLTGLLSTSTAVSFRKFVPLTVIVVPPEVPTRF